MKLNVGKPVFGDELVGRERETDLIIKTLLAGQSVALIAPRRFGKTSIMLEVLDQLSKKKYYTGNVDLFTTPDISQLAFETTAQVLRNRKLDTAFYKIKTNLSEILRNIKFRNEIQDAEFILSFGRSDRNEWEQLRDSLNYIDKFATKHNKNICFAFDEFGDINKLDGEEIVKLFRGIIQHQENSVFIFTGSYESVMDQLFVTNKSPFFRMVRIIEPGFINSTSAEKFLRNKFKELKLKISIEDIQQAIQFTKGHPYYLRLFLQEYYLMSSNSSGIIDIKETFSSMFMTEKNYIEKLWDEISSRKENKYLILRLVETSGKPYSGIEDNRYNLTRAIRDMKGKGVIMSIDSTYILSDPLLEMFIKEKVLKL
jgi:uncharacterized protein